MPEVTKHAPGSFCWMELNTSDPAAAREFYVGQFGWDDSQFMDMGEMGEYRFLEQNGTRIGALCGVMPGGQPAWRFYFRGSALLSDSLPFIFVPSQLAVKSPT